MKIVYILMYTYSGNSNACVVRVYDNEEKAKSDLDFLNCYASSDKSWSISTTEFIC